MSEKNQELVEINERLNNAGYHAIDPEGALASLFTSATDADSYLKLECLLECLLHTNTQSNAADHRDLNGALLCLTDGVLQLNNIEEARRIVSMLFQMCIVDSPVQHRRSFYHSFLKKTDRLGQTEISIN